MFRPRYTFAGIALVALLLAPIIPACKKPDQAASPAGATPAAASAPDNEIVAILAKADAVDGTEDKVIAKCAGCSLNMDGSGDHALQTHGYTMHFCSGECKGPFESDPDKAILAMNVPGD
jgi:YHS domain-containing protein